MEDELNEFIKTTYKFRDIDRDMLYPNKIIPENDAEHVCQLLLVAWFIIDKDGLPLNKEKVFKIALAHDLVEIHAGDVPLWGKNGHDKKVELEKQAVEILDKELPKNREIIDSIKEYKSRGSEEAIFVHALDKLLPFMNQLNIEGAIWKKHSISLEQTLNVLDKQKTFCPYLQKYFESRIEFLKNNEDLYFN